MKQRNNSEIKETHYTIDEIAIYMGRLEKDPVITEHLKCCDTCRLRKAELEAAIAIAEGSEELTGIPDLTDSQFKRSLAVFMEKLHNQS